MINQFPPKKKLVQPTNQNTRQKTPLESGGTLLDAQAAWGRRLGARGRMGSLKCGGCLPDFKGFPAGFVMQVVKPKKTSILFWITSEIKSFWISPKKWIQVVCHLRNSKFVTGINKFSGQKKAIILISTLPKINMFAPENRPLEKDIPIGNHHCWGLC